MMKWIYSEYFSVYTQYITYFTTIIILLTSASAISFIKMAGKKDARLITVLFLLSLILSIIDIFIIFDIFDGMRSMLLLMSSNCAPSNGDIACDVNIQEQSEYLKNAIRIAIVAFLLLAIGYFFKIRKKNA